MRRRSDGCEAEVKYNPRNTICLGIRAVQGPNSGQ